MSAESWIGGVHAVSQALSEGRVQRIQVAEHKRSKNVLALIEAATAANVAVEQVAAYTLDITLPGVKHQGVMAAVRPTQDAALDWRAAIAGVAQPLILVLDSIQDPHNLGACVRSAAAAGVHALLIPNSRAAEVNATVEKVACGGVDIVPIFRVANLRRELQAMQQQGIWVVGGAGEAAQSLYEIDLTVPLAVVVGNEGEGIHYGIRQQCDHLAAIPMDKRMESLNVSVACALMLFEARRQRL